MIEALGPLMDQLGPVAVLGYAGLIFLWRTERADRKESESREREATKVMVAAIQALTAAIEESNRDA